MKNFSDLQEKVITAAKEILQKYSWYSGVCVDNVPSDKEIELDFEEAVQGVVFETAMWDDPDFY